jgi:hypothetical protein
MLHLLARARVFLAVGLAALLSGASSAIADVFSLDGNGVTPEQLPELRAALTSMMTRLIPNLQIVKSDFIDINAHRWVILETLTPSRDRKIHNIEIATSYRGVMLTFNFSAESTVFDTVQDQLQTSLQSVKINDAAPNPSSLPSTTAAPVTADQEVARGQAAIARGDMPLAKEAFNAALLLDPNNAAARDGLKVVDAQSTQPASDGLSTNAPASTSPKSATSP